MLLLENVLQEVSLGDTLGFLLDVLKKTSSCAVLVSSTASLSSTKDDVHVTSVSECEVIGSLGSPIKTLKKLIIYWSKMVVFIINMFLIIIN